MRHLDQAVAARPVQPALWLNIAQAYLKLGGKGAALESAKNAAALAPGDTSIQRYVKGLNSTL